jgi:hypothetical protein
VLCAALSNWTYFVPAGAVVSWSFGETVMPPGLTVDGPVLVPEPVDPVDPVDPVAGAVAAPPEDADAEAEADGDALVADAEPEYEPPELTLTDLPVEAQAVAPATTSAPTAPAASSEAARRCRNECVLPVIAVPSRSGPVGRVPVLKALL